MTVTLADKTVLNQLSIPKWRTVAAIVNQLRDADVTAFNDAGECQTFQKAPRTAQNDAVRAKLNRLVRQDRIESKENPVAFRHKN